MSAQRVHIALSLMSAALVLVTLGVANASAKGTTLAECTKEAGNTKDFADAHCEEPRTPGTGTFGHIHRPVNSETQLTTVNDLTGTASSFILEGRLAGIVVKVECKKVNGTGTATNKEIAGAMSLAFGNVTLEFSECIVVSPEKCTVTIGKAVTKMTDPMNLGLSSTEVEGPTGAKYKPVEEGKGTEMGLKFGPTVEGGTLMTPTFAGAECPAAVKGEKPVKGFFYATSGRGSSEATSSSDATLKITTTGSAGVSWIASLFGSTTVEETFTLRKSASNPAIVTTTTN